MKLMRFIKLFPREDLRIRYPDLPKIKKIKGKLERQYLHDRR